MSIAWKAVDWMTKQRESEGGREREKETALRMTESEREENKQNRIKRRDVFFYFLLIFFLLLHFELQVEVTLDVCMQKSVIEEEEEEKEEDDKGNIERNGIRRTAAGIHSRLTAYREWRFTSKTL